MKVRLLVDFSLPVFKLAPHVAAELAAAGVQVRYYNTATLLRFFAVNHRTHRKLLVADRRVAIVGGRNIGDDYFDLSPRYNFLDSDLLIDGPVAAAISDSFELYWASDWVARPGAEADDAAAAQSQTLLGPAEPALLALATELQAHATKPAAFTCDGPALRHRLSGLGRGTAPGVPGTHPAVTGSAAADRHRKPVPGTARRRPGRAGCAGAAWREAEVPDQQPALPPMRSTRSPAWPGPSKACACRAPRSGPMPGRRRPAATAPRPRRDGACTPSAPSSTTTPWPSAPTTSTRARPT